MIKIVFGKWSGGGLNWVEFKRNFLMVNCEEFKFKELVLSSLLKPMGQIHYFLFNTIEVLTLLNILSLNPLSQHIFQSLKRNPSFLQSSSCLHFHLLHPRSHLTPSSRFHHPLNLSLHFCCQNQSFLIPSIPAANLSSSTMITMFMHCSAYSGHPITGTPEQRLHQA
jgi:hypothetical protein